MRTRDWPANWIDSFLIRRQEEAGIAPASEADRVTLLRRVAFDLTGLPPVPTAVESFLADESPLAWNRVVDRLLASEAFGERLAAYWLDLVRFADTVGYHGDQDHHISPYRDWVIDALNDNMPFDQFTREQLAGDLLPGGGMDERIASGYNRLLQTSHEGGVQAKEYLAIYAADHVRNLSAAWWSHHWLRPMPQSQVRSVYGQRFLLACGVFADVDEGNIWVTAPIPTQRCGCRR